MINLLYIFLALVIIKLVINLNKYYQCKRYLNKYHNWRANTDPDWQLVENKSNVIKLFKDAGLEDSIFSFETPVGLSHVGVRDASFFDNFPNNRIDIVRRTDAYFHQAIGIYRSRMLELFNPNYWIEFIIYLPRQVFNYLGISHESVILKVFQLLYWLIVAVITILYALYSPEINILGRDWINKVLS